MREIKFRWWNGQKMIPGENLQVLARNLKNMDNLMQFTGLFDKEGKEVYEGDVVRRVQKMKNGRTTKMEDDHTPDDFIAEVIWHKYATKFVVFPPDCDGLECGRDLYFFGYGYIEVIGNRYEHDHLLEG